ncbi:MAG: hypothetical protein HYR85_16165, partial [Planctomycetes bacterium]|nr:hypothetical protein [Planctomycetota bacterium]
MSSSRRVGRTLFPRSNRSTPPSAGVERFTSRATTFVSAASMRLVDDPEDAFATLLAAIQGARERILLEWYWFAADRAGTRIAESLIERACNGVDVAVLYDAIGSISTPRSFFGKLTEAGARVLEYHPVGLILPFSKLNRRDHRKLLAVDGEIAIVGGLNLCDENAPESWGGLGWRDSAVEIRGARAVLPFERIFTRTWLRVGGSRLHP